MKESVNNQLGSLPIYYVQLVDKLYDKSPAFKRELDQEMSVFGCVEREIERLQAIAEVGATLTKVNTMETEARRKLNLPKATFEELVSALKEVQDEEMRLHRAELEARDDWEQRMLARQEKSLEGLRLKDRIDYLKRHG